MRSQKEEWKVYKNVFDNFTLLKLEKLRSQGHFDELSGPIALGKEANVFVAKKGKGKVAVKIYRLENCNFNQMYRYIAPDPRYFGLKRSKRQVVLSWVQREYRNLLKAREVIRVPMPIAVRDNVIVMEFIGGDQAAPQLKDSPPKNPKKFFDATIDFVRQLHKAGLVHADLSSFNILNLNEEPVFIDFSQTTTTEHPNADEFLNRDVANLVNFFKKLGLKLDEKEVVKKIIA